MLHRDTWLDGRRVDLRTAGGRVVRIAPAASLSAGEGEEETTGGLVCPPFAEPHVHLDAALLGRRAPNRSGTLREGIANWAALRAGLTAGDVRERALQTVRWYVRNGTLRIRTHVDPGSRAAVEALLALRDDLASGLIPAVDGTTVPVELQVAVFPQEGILRAPGQRERWEQAVALGCDAVGAIPHFERTAEEGARTVRLAFDLAERTGLRVDLHCDETDDPGSRHLEVACAEALERGMTAPGQVVAGHCTSLHSQPDAYAAKVIELVALSRLVVVTNPFDNIVLQGRHDGYPRRRGHTRVDELWAAGASVGIGHDSVMDPWYRLGTASLVDAAHMLVHYAHLTGEDEMVRVFTTLSRENHLPFGPAPTIAEGGPATLLWFDADDPIEVLRLRAVPRVFFDGREVCS